MHPFTQERLEQEIEYEQSLLEDIRKEEQEAILKEIYERQKQPVEAPPHVPQTMEAPPQTAGGDDEEEDECEEEPQLTLEQLREIRLRRFMPCTDTTCKALTVRGSKCRIPAQKNGLCRIHMRSK